MAIRTIAHLKSYFQGVPKTDKPTAAEWTDLIDTISWYYDMANAAQAAASAVIIVADEAALLAGGPTYAIGQRIKQDDIGKTWVKQQQPGTSLADYGEIGDTAIVVSDVIGLQQELDRRLFNDVDDRTSERLGIRNTFTTTIGQWMMLSSSPTQIQITPNDPALNYTTAAVTEDFELRVLGSFQENEMRSVTGFIYNSSLTDITGNMGDANMIGTNGQWPVIVPPSTWLMVTLTWVVLPDLGNVVLVAYNEKK